MDQNKILSTKNRRRALMVLVTVLIIVVVIAVINKRGTVARRTMGDTFSARRGDLTISVIEGGSIRASTSIKYTCEVERRGGELSILSIVPAGTYITQEDVDNNMVLVELDSSALKERWAMAKMELATEEEDMTSSKESYEIQTLQNESDIADGELNTRFTLLAIQKYLGSDLAEVLTKDINTVSNLTEHVIAFQQEIINAPILLDGSAAGQELKRLNDEVVVAQGSLKNAQATLTGTERLHEANYVSDLDLDRDRMTLINRQFALENAIVNLDLFLKYDFPKNIEQFISDYREACRRLERTHAQCRSRMASAQARLSNSKEQVAEEQSAVAWYKKLIDKCLIYAKAPGLVIYGTGSSSDSYSAMRGRGGSSSSGIIAAGENVRQGQTIISMPDTASMIAEISVHETEVDKVRPGQLAKIVMDAFPDRELQGKVIEIAPLPDEQQGFMNPDLKVYKTLVSIDGSHEFLRTRMSCRVEIFVEQLNDVVLVPIQVVANRRGRKVAYVVNSHGDPEERQVKPGMFNDIFVQITEGIEGGDEVLLSPPMFMDTDSSPEIQLEAEIDEPKVEKSASGAKSKKPEQVGRRKNTGKVNSATRKSGDRM